MKRSWILFLVMIIPTSLLFAQQSEQRGRIKINGEIMEFLVDECGDTVLMAQLEDVSISSKRMFDNPEDLKTYRRYRRYAYHVYPYAAEAIKIFREVEFASDNMRNHQRKKYIRILQKDLKDEFEDPLRKLTKTQGRILFKMIERETETSMFELLKGLKGGASASYWGTLGRLYGHRLKDGYVRGEDSILDLVLDDIDISYEVEKRAIETDDGK